MNQPGTLDMAFFGWWLLLNGWIQYLEIDFLCGVTSRPGRNLIPLWIGINELFIGAKLLMGMPDGFLLHVLLLLLFGVSFLRQPGIRLQAFWKKGAAVGGIEKNRQP